MSSLKRKRTVLPLPPLVFSNINNLDQKIGDLRIRFRYDHLFFNSCVLAFFETNIGGIMNVEDVAVSGFTALMMDRSKALRSDRPVGLCIYINNKWCTDYKLCTALCTQNVEILTILMKPHSFPEVLISFVLIPLDAEVSDADRRVRTSQEEMQTKYPQTSMLMMGYFNSSFTSSYEHQYMKRITRKDEISEMCYGNIRKAYKAKHYPPLGQEDRSIIELIPAKPQIFKQRGSRHADLDRQSCELSGQIISSPNQDDFSGRRLEIIMARNPEQEELQVGQHEIKVPVLSEALQEAHLGESQNMQNTQGHERERNEHQTDELEAQHNKHRQREHAHVHELQQKHEEKSSTPSRPQQWRRMPQPLTLRGFMRQESQKRNIVFPLPPSSQSSNAGPIEFKFDSVGQCGVGQVTRDVLEASTYDSQTDSGVNTNSGVKTDIRNVSHILSSIVPDSLQNSSDVSLLRTEDTSEQSLSKWKEKTENNPTPENTSAISRASGMDTRTPSRRADASDFAKDIKTMQTALPDIDLELGAMAECLACMVPTCAEDVEGAFEEVVCAFNRLQHSVQVCRERWICSGVMQSQEQEIDHREEMTLPDSLPK